MSMYNLIEYSNNYSKTTGSLRQYYRDEPTLTDAGALANFPGNSVLFKIKQKITGSTGNDGTKDVKIMVPLKYLSNYRRTLEIPLINCKIRKPGLRMVVYLMVLRIKQQHLQQLIQNF